jgi:hypothetical protein
LNNLKTRLTGIVVVGMLSIGMLACSSTTTANIDAQALADAQGLLNVTKAIVASIEQNDPAALAAQQVQITAAENAASAAIASLSANTLAIPGATTLQTVDDKLNSVLQAVGAALPAAAIAFPAIAPFVAEYDAAVALLPLVENWVNSTIQNTQVTTPVVASAAPVPLKMIKTAYTADQARTLLGIPTVKK